MKFKITYFYEILIYLYKTALYLAIEKENLDIIKLLLSNDKIDVNILSILNFLYIKFKIIRFNFIQIHIF